MDQGCLDEDKHLSHIFRDGLVGFWDEKSVDMGRWTDFI